MPMKFLKLSDVFCLFFMHCCYEHLHKPLHQITNWNHIRYQAHTRVNMIHNFTTWQYKVIFHSVQIEKYYQIFRGKCIKTLIWWTNIDSIFDTCLNKLMRKCTCNQKIDVCQPFEISRNTFKHHLILFKYIWKEFCNPSF